MIGTEYLEPADRLENNFFNGGIMTSAAEMGVLSGGSWLLNRSANSAKREYGASKRAFNATQPSSYYGRYQSPEFKELASTKNKIGAYNKASKSLSRLSKLSGVMGMFVLGFELADGIFGASQSFLESRKDIERGRRRPVYNSEDSYFDSRAAFTSRQRAIQVIHNSQMSGGRKAFGEESSWLHY